MMKSALLGIALCSLALGSVAMELGTNFWDLGWHDYQDCFKNRDKVNPADPWNPQFLEEIKIYSTLRFMDWGKTNDAEVTSWEQRILRSNPSQKIVAYEYMIELCNRNNSNMWVCYPTHIVNATMTTQVPDYALRLGILIKTGVDMKKVDLTPFVNKLATMSAADFIAKGGVKTTEPLRADLKVYFEYSNETWNPTFDQWDYCKEQAKKINPTFPPAIKRPNDHHYSWAWHPFAAIRCHRAIDLVFGENHPQVVKVMAAQRMDTQVFMNKKALETQNPWNVKIDALAVAGYFGDGEDGSLPDFEAKMREQMALHTARHAELAKLAKEYGWKMLCYEGGQHLRVKADMANYLPVMYNLYMDYFEANKHYFDLFIHYVHVGKCDEAGCWGAILKTGQTAGSPKYKALSDWSARYNTNNTATHQPLSLLRRPTRHGAGTTPASYSLSGRRHHSPPQSFGIRLVLDNYGILRPVITAP